MARLGSPAASSHSRVRSAPTRQQTTAPRNAARSAVLPLATFVLTVGVEIFDAPLGAALMAVRLADIVGAWRQTQSR